MLEHLSQDLILKPVIEQIKLPDYTQTESDVYWALLESITSQQLSVKAADTIFKRFLALFPDNYPSPELVMVLEMEKMRAVGLSQQKSTYLKNVAHFALDKGLDWQTLQTKTDSEVIDYLTVIKGVGKWTVEMILMFTLHRPDVFPIDDLGIQNAMVKLYNLSSTGKELKKEMLKIAENWSPYRTLACRYLWRWRDTR
ncbi:MAG: DNA-3-methyladenine glycosylase 2 family protein [Microscillaceae bacterium]|jgi:DNA-3-methyladenine glycosylase II|nr:DNA-3-methyladenine glycosylase 2 family protein [Microscillaceae bacterium]